MSSIDSKFIYNKSENLQEFYDEFVKIINLAIKKFVPLKKKNISFQFKKATKRKAKAIQKMQVRSTVY